VRQRRRARTRPWQRARVRSRPRSGGDVISALTQRRCSDATAKQSDLRQRLRRLQRGAGLGGSCERARPLQRKLAAARIAAGQRRTLVAARMPDSPRCRVAVVPEVRQQDARGRSAGRVRCLEQSSSEAAPVARLPEQAMQHHGGALWCASGRATLLESKRRCATTPGAARRAGGAACCRAAGAILLERASEVAGPCAPRRRGNRRCAPIVAARTGSGCGSQHRKILKRGTHPPSCSSCAKTGFHGRVLLWLAGSRKLAACRDPRAARESLAHSTRRCVPLART